MIDLLNSPSVLQAAGGAMTLAANWIVQSTLLIAAGLLLGSMLRRRGSAVQSLVYRTTLLAALACPLATFVLSLAGVTGWSIQTPATWAWESAPADAPVAAPSEPAAPSPPTREADDGRTFDQLSRPETPLAPPMSTPQTTPTSATIIPSDSVDPAPAPPPAAEHSPAPAERRPVFTMTQFGRVTVVALAAWAAIGGVLALRLAASWAALSRLRRRASAADEATRHACRELAGRLRVRAPDVLRSPFLPSPCLAGIRRPAVLLPEADAEIALVDVLTHELAHLKRRDTAWNLLRRAATAVFFFQPLLWRLSRRIEATAEEVCDDYVVGLGADRGDYADRLVNIAELSLAPAGAAGVGIVSLRSMLARRVARIMDTSRTLSTRVGNLLLLVVLLGGLVCTGVVGLVGLSGQALHAESAQSDDQPALETEVDGITVIRGIVLDPDGMPFAKATVEVQRWRDADEPKEPLATATSAADGRFEIAYPEWDYATIVASAEGYGAAFERQDKLERGERATLRLVHDDVPVTGRVVDLEGNPLAGVTVRVLDVSAPKDNRLDAWLEALGRGEILWEASNRLFAAATPQPPANLPDRLTTASDGTFSISGVGAERRLRMALEGPTIAYTEVTAVTRNMAPVVANDGMPDPEWSRKHTIYGSDFQVVAPPTQPIEGVVRDADTGEPLPGVIIESYRMTERGVSGQRLVRTTSDAQGRYRLIGMPKGSGKQVIALPSDEQPYLMREFDAPDKPGLEPIDVDLELHRGVWITGRLTEAETGEPVGAPAQVHAQYYPYRDNPYAQTLPEYDENGNTDGYQQRYKVARDGRFRLVGVPGKAIVGIAVWNGSYPQGQGSEQIEGADQNGHFPTFRLGVAASRKSPTVMREVDIPEGTSDFALDFQLDRGRSVRVAAVDPAGNAVGGLQATGVAHRSAWTTVDESPFDVRALAKSEERTLLLHQVEKRLGKVVQVSASDSPDELTVELAPCVTVRGRIVDGNEQPISGARIRMSPRPGGDFSPELKEVFTDKDGRFEHDGVLPGTTYDVMCESVQDGFDVLAKDLPVTPGEAIDLGAIDVTSDKRPEPIRNVAGDAAAAPDSEETVTMRGRVVDDSGRPVPGATVSVVRSRGNELSLTSGRHQYDQQRLEQVGVDSDGRFSVEVPRIREPAHDALTTYREPRLKWKAADLVAAAPGYAPDWVRSNNGAYDREVVLTLNPQLQTIRGRVLGIEGQPIEGVTVELMMLARGTPERIAKWARDVESLRAEGKLPTPSRDGMLNVFMAATAASPPPTPPAPRRSSAYPGHERLRAGSLAIPTTIKSDSEGRFEIPGLPADQLATLALSGAGVEQHQISVVTREMAPFTTVEAICYGAEFDHVAPPGVTIDGVVKDVETGEPIVGATVTSWVGANQRRIMEGRINDVTDDAGRFRIEGMPIGEGNEIKVIPRDDQPYLVTSGIAVPAATGAGPVEVEVELRKGVFVTGKLTDAESGDPVEASIHVHPLLDNPHARDYANFDPNIMHMSQLDGGNLTAPDGTFRVVAVPGENILGVMPLELGPYCAGLGSESIPGLTDEGRYPTYDHCSPRIYSRLLALDIPSDAESITRDLTVSRGSTARLLPVDPAGNAVSGVRASNRTPYGHTGSQPSGGESLEVVALRPGEVRPVLLLQQDRRLAKVVHVEAPEKSGAPPTLVRLEQCASAVARVVDGDGAPVSGFTFRASLIPTQDFGITVENATSDKEGRVEFKYLAPGGVYQLGGYHQDYGWVNLIKELEMEPDDTVDLGTVDVSREERPKLKVTTHAPAGDASAKPSGVGVTTLRGRVVSPDGQPVAGATVRLGSYDRESRIQTRSGQDGRFTIDFDKTRFTYPEWHEEPWRMAMLTASAEGFGPDWIDAQALQNSPNVTLTLTPDVPIRGQVLDLEGRPVVDAELTVSQVYSPLSGDLDTLLEMVRDASQELNMYLRRDCREAPASLFDLRATVGQRSDTEGATIITTDDQGRFAVHGLGAERYVRLSLKAPGVESTSFHVVTRAEIDERLRPRQRTRDAEMMLDSGSPLPEAYAADFQHFAAPSRPITGVVRDKATGEPLAGIPVGGWLRNTNNHANATTDDQGRYTLTGLALEGTFQQLYAGPREEMIERFPYVGAEKERVTYSVSSPPTGDKVDFELTRGVTVRGRVTDAITGRPVKARVEYLGTEDNPHVQGLTDTLWPYSDVITDDDGKFSLVVLPGPGALAVWTRLKSDLPDLYLPAAPQEFGLPVSDDGMIPTANKGYIFPHSYKAARFIDFAPGEEPAEIALSVQPITNVSRVRSVDESGEVIDGVSVLGHQPWSKDYEGIMNGGLEKGRGAETYIELAEMDDPDRQPVYFRQREKNLATMLYGAGANRTPRFDQLPRDADGARRLTLGPAATVTGRFVDDEGRPARRVQVELALAKGAEGAAAKAPLIEVADAYSDDNGRFNLRHVPSGGPYVIAAGAPDLPLLTLMEGRSLEPGETVDLGEIDVTSGQPSQPRRAEARDSTTSVEGSPASRQTSISGAVKTPDGQPAPDADVALVAMRIAGTERTQGEVLAESKADAEGAFRLTLPPDVTSKTHAYASVMARKAGAAIAWRQVDLDAGAHGLALELGAVEPIKGRLVDIEGKPAAGVRLVVQSVMRRSEQGSPSPDGVGFRDDDPPAAWLPAVESDDEGRFTITGVPAGCGVFLQVDGDDRFAPQDIALNTGLPEQRGERDATYRALTKNGEPDEELLLPLAPAQAFEGTITYEDTGAPAPHARVTIWASQQEFGSMMSVEGFTNERGEYRIAPNPGIRFGVNAFPPEDTPYLARQTPLSDAIRWEAGDRGKRADMKLPRGVLVRGRLVEAQSGDPVAGATVQYAPESANNPNTADDILTGWQATKVSDEHGRFAIAVLPGAGWLLVQEQSGQYVTHAIGERRISADEEGGRWNYVQGFQRVEPKAGADALDATIELQRGAPASGRIVDRQGRPVDQAIVVSRHNGMPRSLHWRGDVTPTLGGRFDVPGLEEGEEITAFFLDAKRRLGATEVIRGGETDREVVLKPCGEAAARFVDAEGQPHVGFHPSLHLVVTPGAHMYDFQAARRGEALADSDFVANIDSANHRPGPETDERGEVVFPALIPGATYRVLVFEDGKSRHTEFTARSGERVEVGEIVVNLNE